MVPKGIDYTIYLGPGTHNDYKLALEHGPENSRSPTPNYLDPIPKILIVVMRYLPTTKEFDIFSSLRSQVMITNFLLSEQSRQDFVIRRSAISSEVNMSSSFV